eukprot:UN32692
MLKIQYRMNKIIAQYFSDTLYNGSLIPDKSVENHLLIDIPNIKQTRTTLSALTVIDTAGCDYLEDPTEKNESKSNQKEAYLVGIQLRNLLNAGLKGKDIVVITPYSAQADVIRKMVVGKHNPEARLIEISTVDSFQGREKEVIIISMVRSNDDGIVGFLKEDRRTNVAVTRAKRHVTIVYDSQTISNHEFLENFVTYCSKNADVRYPIEYENEEDVDVPLTEEEIQTRLENIAALEEKK